MPEDTADDSGIETQQQPTPWWAWLILAGFGLLVGLVFYRLYPTGQPPNDDPSFIDVVFANNLPHG